MTIAQPGNYAVTVTADALCFSAADTVTIAESSDCDSVLCPLLVPNAFTPNNDGFNDRFVPIGNCPELRNYRFQVFSRWGEMVFASESPQNGWNGLIDGKPAVSDVYVWVLRYNDQVKGVVKTQGDITLLR